ncbi:MAG: NAD(P)/FAD-dependent oxidoreductase [Elusimicrobia bacterium]|nr:NAD(P)/FAD-dependent oxidoreductase [Elusimicrobiota bacterium]
MRRVETVIVGGGPAGSSCAWELRRRGRECIILERQALPKFKLCAGWITPRVLQSLELNAADYPHGLETLRRMRVYLGGSRARLEYATLQYSIRRAQFDGWLLKRSGAEVVRHAARRIVRDAGGFVVDDLWRCRYLVGAGGTNCPVKRAFFAADRGRLVLTQEVEYDAAPRDPVCTLFFPFAGLAGYGWYVPKADGINIGYGGVAGRLRLNVKAYWESFIDVLRRRGLIDGAPPPPASHPYYIGDRRKTVFSSGAFITGDAAGLATADMGEGIGPAVESGLRAARHIADGPAYDVSRIPLFTLPGLAGRLIAGL